MGIRKRGRIYWIRYADSTGRIREESSKSHRKKDAEDLLIMRKAQVREGALPELRKPSTTGFHVFSKEYLKWAERQKSYRSKVSFVNQLCNNFANIPLTSFNTKMVERWQSGRLKERNNKPATVNRILAVFKHMFTKAYEWEMIPGHVREKVRKVKMLPASNGRIRYLNLSECHRLIDSCDHHLRPIVVTALNTGMRKSEILTLKWDNIDMEHGLIRLEDTKNGERRDIPINSVLINELRSIPHRFDSTYVFPNPEGTPFTDIKKSFRSARKRTGIEDFRFHDLRHTFASHMVMSGADLRTVQELLGHKTLSMTMKYSHLAPDHRAKMVEKLGKKLSVDERNSTADVA